MALGSPMQNYMTPDGTMGSAQGQAYVRGDSMPQYAEPFFQELGGGPRQDPQRGTYLQGYPDRPQSQFGGYNPYSQPQSQFGGYNPYSQGGLGGGFGGRYGGGGFGASPMRYQGGNYGGGMGQIMPTNIPYRDPGYGSPMRSQNLIQNLGGHQSLRDPYRAQSSMNDLYNFRGNQYGSPQAGMPPVGGRPGGKGGRSPQMPGMGGNPGIGDPPRVPFGDLQGGGYAGGRPGGKGGRGGGQGEMPASNTSGGLMTGDPAPAQPAAPLGPLTDSRLAMGADGRYSFTGDEGNVMNDLTRSGAESMIAEYGVNPEAYRASFAGKPPEEQGVSSAPAPVWPAPGSKHPDTGETQEEISARWKRETAAEAAWRSPETGESRSEISERWKKEEAAKAAAAGTVPPAQPPPTQAGAPAGNLPPNVLAAMRAAGVDPATIMQGMGNIGFSRGGQVNRQRPQSSYNQIINNLASSRR
tara:strand:- start:2275 stop:3678 length:1404 start_codon:yes stop_codon:yes gene_type:complete